MFTDILIWSKIIYVYLQSPSSSLYTDIVLYFVDLLFWRNKCYLKTNINEKYCGIIQYRGDTIFVQFVGTQSLEFQTIMKYDVSIYKNNERWKKWTIINLTTLVMELHPNEAVRYWHPTKISLHEFRLFHNTRCRS